MASQERSRREILQRGDLIPPLPGFVLKLMSALNDPETEPEDLEPLLNSDPVLVAKLLAMVNSPFYGVNRAVVSVRDAVMVLGFRGLRSLILAASTARFLSRDFSNYGYGTVGLWQHSAATACGSRLLARRLRLPLDVCEELFVAGLLHDIGKMLTTGMLTSRGLTSAMTPGASMDQEVELLGIDHAEAGGLVTAKWNLTPRVQECVSGHHRVGLDAEGGADIAVVALANLLANREGFGLMDTVTPALVDEAPLLAALRMDASEWSELQPEMLEAMHAAVASLATISH